MNRRNFAYIAEEIIDGLIHSALLEGAFGEDAWSEESHLIALSVALRIRIYLFNRLWTPAQWEKISADLNSNCVPVQV